MTIDQHGAAARLLFVVRPNHGMARRGAKFRGQTDLSQLFHQPMAALGYFFRVMIVGRDTGEAEELIKIFEMTCAHGCNVSDGNALVILSPECFGTEDPTIGRTLSDLVRNDRLRGPSHSLEMTAVLA